jgi:predicted SnoaL-like aldol condensation-catalyzing enzyme
VLEQLSQDPEAIPDQAFVAPEPRVQRFLLTYRNAWADPQKGRMAEIWSEDAEMMHPEFEHPMQGREALMEYLRQFLGMMPDLRVIPVAVAANGDTVFIRFVAEGTIGDRKLRWEGVDHFQLDGERAVRGAGFFDTTKIRDAVGTIDASSLRESMGQQVRD